MAQRPKTDDVFLAQAIELSQRALRDEGKTPFGAILVIDGEVIAEGTSSVIELADPTAHAEVMALRNAGKKLGRHLFPDAVMYASSEPCPMCLTACYWARIPRLMFGANCHDVGMAGFEDLQLYRELAGSASSRSLKEQAAGPALRAQALRILKAWSDALPHPVEPKL
jgi:tRNA(Arg) A34 adenosine deaminase TadA